MKHIFLLAGTLLTSLFSVAQSAGDLSQEYGWSTHQLRHNGSSYGFYSGSFAQFNLPLNDSEKAIPIYIAKEEWGVAKVNDKGRSLWQTRTPGEVRGIGKVGEHIIAISVDKFPKVGIVTATLINSASGKELLSKTVYKNNSGNLLEIKVQNKPDGSFTGILIRTTNDADGGYTLRSNLADLLATKKMEMVLVNDQLEARVIPLKTSIAPDIFLGCTTNAAGDLFIAGAGNESLYMFQLGPDGREKARLSTPLTYTGSVMPSMIERETADDNKIYISFSYHPRKNHVAFRLFSFDFGGRKVSSSEEQPLEKSYEKSLQLTSVKNVQSGPAKPISELFVSGIIPWKGGVALLSEVKLDNVGLKGETSYFYNRAWVLTVYDKNLRTLKTVGVDKQFSIQVSMGRSIGYHVKGDQLYVVCPVKSGFMKYSTLISTVDLNTGAISTEKLDRDDIRDLYFIEAGATLWFDNSYVLQYLVPQSKILMSTASYKHCLFLRRKY